MLHFFHNTALQILFAKQRGYQGVHVSQLWELTNLQSVKPVIIVLREEKNRSYAPRDLSAGKDHTKQRNVQ